jgi:hypothetical protein
LEIRATILGKIMRKKQRLYSVLALYVIFIVAYTLFFILSIDNSTLFLILTISSVAVLSSSTIYTVIQSTDSQGKKVRDKKLKAKQKSLNIKSTDLIEDYIDALPSMEEYVESNDSYEKSPIINKYIFSVFSEEELYKIDLLNLSKMEKILFIREMLYFNLSERKELIENMLKTRDNTDEEIIYAPPTDLVDLEDQIRVYIRSLIEPGEKTKIIILDTTELISVVKKKVGILFDYNQQDFVLSSGGILLQENYQIKDYDIEDDDEIALIPSRKEKI